MHSLLRDRAARTTTWITVTLLGASVFSIAFAFAGDIHDVEILGVSAARSTWLGVLAILTFVGTLIDLVTDHRAVARSHESAVRLLADLKADYRQTDPSETPPARAARLTSRYQSVMAQIPPIPEKAFNKLKSAHLRKVEISKILSANPGMKARAAEAALDRRLKAAGVP
jgi:hypothetical protein